MYMGLGDSDGMRILEIQPVRFVPFVSAPTDKT
jgi:hypothetical protein